MEQRSQLLPKHRNRRVYWYLRSAQSLCIIGGVSLLVFACVGGRDLPDGFSWAGVTLFIVFALGWCLFLFSFILHRLAKSACAPDATEVLARDTRPPIVFLRPFSKDQLLHLESVEDCLCKVFQSHGPIVAIGKPGEAFQSIGAARIYCGNDQWRDVVQDLLSKAQAVLLIAGTTDGVEWELRTVLQHCPPAKVLLVTEKLEEYRHLRQLIALTVGSGLPALAVDESTRLKNCEWSKFLAAFVFDNQWSPHRLANIHELQARPSNSDGGETYHEVFSMGATLAPFLSRLAKRMQVEPLSQLMEVAASKLTADSEQQSCDVLGRMTAAWQPLANANQQVKYSSFQFFLWRRQSVIQPTCQALFWLLIVIPLPAAMYVFPAGENGDFNKQLMWLLGYLLTAPCFVAINQIGEVIENLAKPWASSVLKVSSLLAAKPIPIRLLSIIARHVDDATGPLMKVVGDPTRYRLLVATAKVLQESGFATLHVSETEWSYGIDRSQSEAIRSVMDDIERKCWATIAVQSLVVALREGIIDIENSSEHIEMVLTHAIALDVLPDECETLQQRLGPSIRGMQARF